MSLYLVSFGGVHVELGKLAPKVEAAPTSPAREPVYYLAILNTDTWVYEAAYHTPTPLYEAPQTIVPA
jgi:hypothetical protein